MEFLELIRRLKIWLDTWLLIVVFALVTDGIIFIAVLQYDPRKHDLAQLAMVGTTLFALIVYALDTHRLALANLLGTTPTVSCNIISGKRYYGFLGIEKELSDVEKEKFYETRVIVKNHSKFSTKAYVNLNFKVNGKSVERAPIYSGKNPYTLNPYQGVDGWFSITEPLDKVGKTVDKMKKERTKENHRTQLTMKIEVENEGFLGYRIKNFPQNFCFDFERDVWINTDYDMDV